ncbi:ABC1 family-domain-containing protein [Boletus edulis BED1]|uniref:ABC1 family-domain-containing protein n=1 Tax=Boletus edulis BED1 TaxID=1328754 RepID=A0AAD4C907_BOLED|nr:ABC1 family-domain-containing protein [Boletus edulis BED1]
MFLQNFSQAVVSKRLPFLFPTKRPFSQFDRRSPHQNNYRGWRKVGRRTVYVAASFGTLWFVDQKFNASAVGRNFRTLWACAMISLDYKLNFLPEKADQIPQLHARVADRMYNLFTSNGGLYIKIGQAIGANSPFLPRPIQDKFARLFDDAPQIPYSDVLSVFRSEFGRPPAGPDGIFDVFEHEAVASASVAQVHRAKLKSGQWVAVKIQKPDVTKQIEWDLGAFRMVMWIFENWMFDLPVYFAVDFINSHLRQELDFVQEAQNARVTAQFIAAEPRLAGKVHIPKVYPEYSTKRVLTAEWIDGVRLSDRLAIRTLMGEDKQAALSSSSRNYPSLEGVRLKGGVKSIMQTMVELFSAQMFSWGWVHCDPHPGNIIIRPHPSKPKYPQLVLLDHGLYVRVEESFRREYATLWRGLLAADWDAIERVALLWGIGTPDLFASATLMQPVRYGKKSKTGNGNGNGSEHAEELNQYEQSVRMKAKLKRFLLDTDKMPKELIFLGRNMRIVQGNNQVLGSPVNRIKITGYWASASLTTSTNLAWTERAKEYWHYLVFRGVMLSIDLAFWTSKVRQWIRHMLGKSSIGFEDELERTMRGFAKSTFGIDVAPGTFEG